MVVIINNSDVDDETENHELSRGEGGLPPGFRFHPTDEEIVSRYLTPKVLNRNFTATAIGEADLNKSEPWELPKIAKMQGEKEWFFFCQRDRKYPTGMRTNRATKSGYWKATGKDKEIFRQVPGGKTLVGMKKTLVFYKGRAPKGEKTNWVMHEFRLEGNFSYYTMPPASSSDEDEWVVCRVFHKNTGLQRSPIADQHGLNSFVDQDDGTPHLMDPSPLNLDPSFNSYFSHDQPEIDDHHNLLLSSYNYMNFNSKSYHMNTSPMFINEHKYDHKLQNTDHGSNINDTTDDITTAETSSVSGLKTRDYYDPDDDDDDVGPSTFSELDSLLEF